MSPSSFTYLLRSLEEFLVVRVIKGTIWGPNFLWHPGRSYWGLEPGCKGHRPACKLGVHLRGHQEGPMSAFQALVPWTGPPLAGLSWVVSPARTVCSHGVHVHMDCSGSWFYHAHHCLSPPRCPPCSLQTKQPFLCFGAKCPELVLCTFSLG
jgi:hypothetical protein